MDPRTTVYSLPTEILSEIFRLLSSPAPSDLRLHEQPSDGLLSTDVLARNLKHISLVCKRWRSVVLPLLFKNVLWRPDISYLSIFNLHPVPLLRFLADNGLSRYVKTFNLLVDFADQQLDARQISQQIRPSDLEWLWDQIFSNIDPLRFTIIAPPSTLAALFNRMLLLDDAWTFQIPYHIISLARSTRGTTENTDTVQAQLPNSRISCSGFGSDSGEQGSAGPSFPRSCRSPKPAPPCPLFTIRPWTSILINEGSSHKAYASYEFFLRSPPSMMSALLGIGEHPNDVPLLPDTIKDFNYIAIFPLASHFYTLVSNLPKVDRLFVQLTPRPNNQILNDKQAMKQIDLADLWMERNTAYSYLIGQLTVPTPQDTWSSLKIFESGDAADKESWDMAVAFLDRSGVKNWKAEHDGVLIKTDDEGNPELPGEMVVHHLLGEESFNGTMLSVPSPQFMAQNLESLHFRSVLDAVVDEMGSSDGRLPLQRAITTFFRIPHQWRYHETGPSSKL